MKRICLLLALCLTLSICAGCGSDPVETTTTPSTAAPIQTTAPTTAPTQTVPEPTDPPEPKVIDFALELPEGFEASVSQEGYYAYISPNAPRDTSCITVELTALDDSVLVMTNSDYANRIDPTRVPEPTDSTGSGETTPSEETAPSAENLPKDFRFTDFQDVEVDGWPGVVSAYTLVYEDYVSHVLRCEVVASDCNYVFTFTDDTAANVWNEAFHSCLDSVDLILDMEGIELDYSGLTLYDLKCGLQIYAENGMEHHDADGFTACIGSRNVIILVMADDKMSNNLTDMDLDGYAALLCRTNDLPQFKWDTYGNLCTGFYSTDSTGMEYYNTIFLKETADDFWVCQMACVAEEQARYAKAFSLWASSIAEN